MKGLTDEFYGFIKSRKHSFCVIDFYLKDRRFTAVKRNAKFETRYVKGAPLVNRRYTKGSPFCEKWYIKWLLDLGAQALRINIC